MRRFFLAAAAALALAGPGPLTGAARANDGSALRAYVEANVRDWAQDPALIAAIKAQNLAHASLTQAQIDTLDKTWRAEVGAADTPTITPVVTNALSDFLRGKLAESGGVIAEAFVMDDRGLLVGASGITSDYWQGDEEKFTLTYPRGPAAVHESAVEFDDSTQLYIGQVSFTISDPATGAAIGAITLGLDAEAIM